MQRLTIRTLSVLLSAAVLLVGTAAGAGSTGCDAGSVRWDTCTVDTSAVDIRR